MSDRFTSLAAGLALGAAALLAAPPASAVPPGGLPPGQAKKVARFLGHHPVAGAPGRFCYIETPHTHDYVPDHPALYQEADGGNVFTGDPVPFGYQGDKTVFYGHHPVPVEAAPGPAPVFCFLKGPHYHDYPAPELPGYKVKDSVVFYVGPLPPEVAVIKPQQERLLEAEYRPFVAQRPQVVVAPPPEWQGTVWVAPPPTVVVAPAAPVVPVVAPASPTVVVAPAHPPAVIVAPPQPAVIIAPMGPPGIVVMPGYGHPGKHKGWYKHGRW
ncbi:MAG: hypothetical protein U1A78_15605 [Polyangia bacterium]